MKLFEALGRVLSSDGRVLLVALSWISAAATMVTAAMLGNTLLVAPIVALAFAVIGSVALYTNGSQSNVLVGVGLIGQAVALTAAFAGHPWQLDSHMVFFALMAVLVILVDVRALIAGCALIVVHHLCLSFILPQLIYPAGTPIESVTRTLFHGAIVGLETAALIYAVVVRQRMRIAAEHQQSELKKAMGDATSAAALADAAKEQAELQAAEAAIALEQAKEANKHAEEQRDRAAQLDREAREAAEREALERENSSAERTRVLETLKAHLNRLSAGDLSAVITTSFPPEFEPLRVDFNTALVGLNEAMTGIVKLSEEIDSSASGITAAAHDLSRRTESQAATLTETSSTVRHLAMAGQKAAEQAASVANASGNASAEAKEKSEIVRSANEAMSMIEESSEQISRINTVIEEISFQTNLLALNAGVEAARAGEAGRGFAVVASEVRELAQRSSEAAREISELIERSGQHVKNGVTLVDRTGGEISKMISIFDQISSDVMAIAQSSKEQANGFSEVDRAVKELDTVTQKNAAMFEESTAASASLANAGSELRATTERFRLQQKHDGLAVKAADAA